MRTVRLGLAIARRSPNAILPLTLQGAVGGLMILLGLFPSGGTSAAATAAFPFDVYFDLKQLLVSAPSWIVLLPALAVSMTVRATVLAGTLSLASRGLVGFGSLWPRLLRLNLVAVAVYVPATAFLLAGIAVRYAPFMVAGAAGGWIAAVFLSRRAFYLLDGPGEIGRRTFPKAGDVMFYAVALAILASMLSVLGRTGRILPALLVMSVGPLHALIVLGWFGSERAAPTSREGRVVTAVVVASSLLLVAMSLFDRSIRSSPPVAVARTRGSLVLLGGVDSTTTTGAMSDLDPRDLGIGRDRAFLLSYSSEDVYPASDTHADLDTTATFVSEQLEVRRRPVYLVGHSQAALILDRIENRGLPGPDLAVELAPPPPTPPWLRIPAPGEARAGKPGGDVLRGLARLLSAAGLPTFQVDAPASPVNLEPVVVEDPATDRLAVWALADSVWLTGDWRRPGSVNIVAMTDHVGVTNNGTALAAARAHISGEPVQDQRRSWRGAMVAALRYLFEPWKPQT